jgi:hypothetical protein
MSEALPFAPGAFVAHKETDVYGPGKVTRVDGELRRVRFTHFIATVHVRSLRDADPTETEEIKAWLLDKQARYGGIW